MRSAILALLALLVAVLTVSCGGSDDGKSSTDEPEAVVAAEGQRDSGEQAEEPTSTGSEPANASDTAEDEPAPDEPDGAATGGPSAATRAAFLDCLAEEGIELGGATDGQAPVDEATATARERCAEEVGLDPDLAGQRGGAGGFAGGGGFGEGGFGEGGFGARILTCLGEQGLSIDGIGSLADLGLGQGRQGGLDADAAQGLDPADAIRAVAELLEIDPDDPAVVAAFEACFLDAGGPGRLGGAPISGDESLIEAIASCLQAQGIAAELDASADADGQFSGLIALAEQLSLDLTDPVTLPALQACLLDPSAGEAADGDAG
ncbi:MAG: hypothetical protein O7A71_04705 [Chloroflexi bacterium]|nr:hypothetical protein [Chloroflexota bacterium]